MSSRDLELRHSAGTYQKRNLSVVRGEGIYLFGDDGKSYIDCIGGIGTAILGHAHPELVAAIADQANTVMALPEMLCNPVRADLQHKLLSFFPESFQRIFLCNSGTEAIEGALKFAKFSTKKSGVIALKRGYHGKTMGSLSVTSDEKYRSPFEPLVPGAHFASPIRVDDIASTFQRAAAGEIPEIAAFIFEPIQGETGVFPLGQEFIKEATAIARSHGALIICDEIQSGMGRSGKMWAHEHLGITPDLVCIAKAIGGGVPMGAIAIGDKIIDLPVRIHTSTFGGNPLACRASLAVLEALLRDKLIENAARIGEYIMTEIRGLGIPSIREVRGKGLMIGIELKEHAGPYLEACTREGLLCLLAGQRVIRLLPPLIISESEAATVVDLLRRALSNPAHQPL